MDVLQYIHERGYIHADIKGPNILMGATKDTQNKQFYLVDFGLATKYNSESEFKPNPKKAHDGTIEYLSRDAHKGVPTRRGDLEVLAYNMIQWLGCPLPWEKNLKDPKAVHKLKEEYMDSIPKFIKACFEKRSPPGPVVDFLNYISNLQHDSDPDYKTIKNYFLSGMDAKDALGKPFNFSMINKTPVKRKAEAKKTPSPKRKPGRRKVVKEASEDEKENVEDDDEPKIEKKGDPRRRNERPKQKGMKKLKDPQYREEAEEPRSIIRKTPMMKKTKPRGNRAKNPLFVRKYM
ncbi:Nucleosomal histone kinase 1 [Gonioctena quinquepunctata]|nr:Nucleosomal histone kinase 1 [Gonioctena quinquepunctata]